MEVTWANNWNGVNHPATAPAADVPAPTTDAVLKRLDLVAELVRTSKPRGDWEGAR